jgi:hypothetical protein
MRRLREQAAIHHVEDFLEETTATA